MGGQDRCRGVVHTDRVQDIRRKRRRPDRPLWVLFGADAAVLLRVLAVLLTSIIEYFWVSSAGDYQSSSVTICS